MYFRRKTADYFRSNFSSIQTLILRFGYLCGNQSESESIDAIPQKQNRSDLVRGGQVKNSYHFVHQFSNFEPLSSFKNLGSLDDKI